MIPPLFKFRSVDAYTLDSLEKGYVYFSNPTTFNDPFEMSVFLDQTSDLEAVYADFMSNDWSGSPIEKEISQMTEEDKTVYLEKIWNCRESREGYLSGLASANGFQEEWKRRMSIFCASATRNNILLWSHYASSHKGIAIEINANADPILQKARKVDTDSPNFPVIDMHHDDSEAKFSKGVLTKSPDWKYEKEYRAIYPEPCENVKHCIAPDAFVSITFGAKILDETREQVIEATRPHLSHVRFAQARLGKRSYSVEFEEYPFDK